MIEIKFAHPEDATRIAPLIAALARLEGKSGPVLSAKTLRNLLSDPSPPFEILIAEDKDATAGEGTIVGYLAFYRAYSLFKPGPAMLVENVYVADTVRGTGVGRRLMARAAWEAVARGWHRLELNVAATNARANAAYAALGFTDPGESVRRLDDGDLERLARRAEPE
jgi:GNAT superfamily N-acetyltransferase